MRVAIVGAGAFGAWCAKFLADAGHDVALVDAYGPANGRASSSDHSRVIRAGYGPDEIYSQWAMQSLRDWQWLSATTGQSLLVRSGALFLGAPGDPYIQDTFDTLTRLGTGVELLDPQEVASRYPQIDTTGLGKSVYEPQAGVIRARKAVQTLVAHIMATARVTYVNARVVVDEQQATPDVRMTIPHQPALKLGPTQPGADAVGPGFSPGSLGERIDADAFVFACGPWLSKVLPQSVGARVRATRQEVLHFGVPPGDGRFSVTKLPVWIDFTAGLYGIPDLDARGFKVGIDRHGPIVDPDTLERLIEPEIVLHAREWIARRFPGMAGAPLVDGHVCQYENSSTGDFLIDRHPQWPTAWIVGGGSGHGFKHGPAVGRYVADLIEGKTSLQSRLTIGQRGTEAARSVY